MAALHAAAQLHRAAYQLPAAIEALDRAMLVRETARDLDNTAAWSAATLTLRGDTKRLKGDFLSAESDLAGAFHAAPNPDQRAEAANALGILAKDTGRLDEAALWYAEALRFARNRPEATASMASVLHNLAGLHHARAPTSPVRSTSGGRCSCGHDRQ